MQTTKRFAGLALSGALLWAAPGTAITPSERCETDKLRTAGKYAFCRLKADAKAIRKGSPPDYSRCAEQYGGKWALIEMKADGACPVMGDAAAIETQTAECTDGLAGAIGGTPPPGCAVELMQCEDEVAACEAELASAESCGNGAIDAGEDCDVGTLDGETCITQGFAGGVLSCAAGCVFDAARCWDDRFTDNGDGTITDNQNGLMWEKKTELDSAANFANPHDADNSYKWAGACSFNLSKYCQPSAAAASLCTAHVGGTPGGCGQCTGGDGVCGGSETIWTVVAGLNASAFAGHMDWRVPTQPELLTLVDYEVATLPVIDAAFHAPGCGAACTDVADPACSCTSGSYWSASTYVPNPWLGWTVSSTDGDSYQQNKTINSKVRAVRGP